MKIMFTSNKTGLHLTFLPTSPNFTLNDLFDNENYVYFQQDGAPPHFPASISQLNSSRSWWTINNTMYAIKTKNIGGTER